MIKEIKKLKPKQTKPPNKKKNKQPKIPKK